MFLGFQFAIPLAIGIGLNLLAALLFPQPTQKQKLGNIDQPDSNYGNPVAWGRGTFKVTGQLMWAKDIEKRTERQRSGKGGGGGSEIEKAFGTFAVLLCEGEIDELQQISLNGNLWYNNLPEADADTREESGNKFEKYCRFYPGSTTQEPDDVMQAHNGVGKTPAYLGMSYLVFVNLPLEEFGNSFPQVSCRLKHTKPFNLGEVIQDLSLEVGIPLSLIDVMQVGHLTETGFVTNEREEARSIIEELQTFFSINIAETDKIYFTRANKNYATGISLSDLGCYQWGSERPELFERTQMNLEELPWEVRFKFYNQDLNFRDDEVYQRLVPEGSFNNRVVVNNNTRICSTRGRMLQQTRNLLALAAQRGDKFKLTLPIHYLRDTEPGLRIWFEVSPGVAQPIEIKKRTIGVNHLIEIEAVACGGIDGVSPPPVGEYRSNYLPQPPYIELDDAALDTAAPPTIDDDTTGQPSGGGGGSVALAGTTQLFVLDTALARDSDAEPGVYLGGYGTGRDWRRASVFVSRNAGNSWETAANLDTYSIVGTCLSTLGNHIGSGDDTTNTLSVRIDSPGELESISTSEFNQGFNVALVGANEFIWFRDAVLTAPKTYTISYFKRGRRGTESFISTHVANERFVLLSSYGVRFPLRPTDIGQNLLFKAVTGSQALDDVTAVMLNYTGRDLEPYSPVDAAATKDNAGNITLNWVRRDRRAGDRTDYASFPMSEVSESYEIEIRNSANTATVRTLTSNTPTVRYPRANQITDFGATQSTINVRIYQISALVGRGYMLAATLTPDTVAATPVITDFSPRSGHVGIAVSIYGSGFTGATAARINGVALTSMVVVSDTEITGVVNTGTTTGLVTVITSGGTATSSAAFVVGAPPLDISGAADGQLLQRVSGAIGGLAIGTGLAVTSGLIVDAGYINGLISAAIAAVDIPAQISAAIANLLDTYNTWTKNQRIPILSVASAASITIDVRQAQGFTIALGHDATIGFSNTATGMGWDIRIETATSPQTLAWTGVVWANGQTPPATIPASKKYCFGFRIWTAGEIVGNWFEVL